MRPPTCPQCKAETKLVELRFGLVATLHPPRVYFRGHALKLGPKPAAMLIKLASTPYVDKEELRGSVSSHIALRVHIVAIRRELPAGLVLANDFGKGYMLADTRYPLRYRRPRQPPEARTGQPAAQ